MVGGPVSEAGRQGAANLSMPEHPSPPGPTQTGEHRHRSLKLLQTTQIWVKIQILPHSETKQNLVFSYNGHIKSHLVFSRTKLSIHMKLFHLRHQVFSILLCDLYHDAFLHRNYQEGDN